MSISLIIRALIILVSCHLSYASLHGQDTATRALAIDAYKKGQHQAMRDVILLLPEEPNDDLSTTFSKNHLIDLQDGQFSKLTADEQLRYYYEHKDQIQYYPEWKAFVRNDISIPNLPYAILDDAPSAADFIIRARELYNLVEEKSVKKAVMLANQLSLSEAIHARRILIETLDLITNSDLKCKKKDELYSAILPHLIIVGDQHTYQVINQINLNQACGNDYLNKILQNIIAHRSSEIMNDSLPSFLKRLSKSQYATFLKVERYSARYHIYRNYFDEDIDHYGKILSAIPLGNYMDEDEIINAMIASESAKSLFYLASKWFVYAKEQNPRACELLSVINAFIDHGIQINTPDGQASRADCTAKQLKSQKSILAYWINNHMHYEWNSDLKKFVNKNILKKDRQQLIHLYKNLNKDNSKLALRAYWKLIASDAILLAEVDKIYSKKLLNYNPNLPNRKYKYLIQLSRLVEYCKSNQISYKSPEELERLTQSLIDATSIRERMDIEDQLIDHLSLGDITAFEIWAIVHSGLPNVKYSATRITNKFYTREIDNILSSDRQLLLLLKKCNLFKLFGDHGSSKYYITKFTENKSPSRNKLNHLRNGILDEDILTSIKYINQQMDAQSIAEEELSLQDFIKSPLLFDEQMIPKITKYNSKSIHKLIAAFKAKQNAMERFKTLQWIETHLPEETAPFLIELNLKKTPLSNEDGFLIDSQTKVQDILAKLTQADLSYDLAYSTKHDALFKKLHAQNIKDLSSSDHPSSSKINRIIQSKFYSASDRNVVLSLIPRISPARNISSLQLRQPLDISELEDLISKVKSKNALSYLLKITDVDKNDALVSFLINHTKDQGTSESGRFFNKLFKKQWFTEYIDAPETSTELKQKIQWILTDYWEGNETLSAFEEEQTMLNIIKIELAGKNLTEKFELILNSFVDNEIKLHIIEKMITQITYQEIPLIIDYYDQVSDIGGAKLYAFIRNDFGIPISDFSDRDVLLQLSQEIRTLDEKHIYNNYLKQIGISLLDENEILDIQRAHAILTEDLVRPFVGTGGSVRDEYVFATIKLLEKEFNMTHGFHPKLNASQSFYKYTSKKRAVTWAAFLEKELKRAL